MISAYLCGPISLGGTATPERVKQNLAVFKEVRGRISPNVRVLDPSELPRQNSWEDYMKKTIPMVCEATYVVLLPDWDLSRGAILEVYLANTLNIPVIFSDQLLTPTYPQKWGGHGVGSAGSSVDSPTDSSNSQSDK